MSPFKILAGYFSLSTQLAHIQMVISTQSSLLRLSELSKKQEVANLAGNLHNSTSNYIKFIEKKMYTVTTM